jgi:RNA polymerase sigma-70 factor (ECF subfamily)
MKCSEKVIVRKSSKILMIDSVNSVTITDEQLMLKSLEGDKKAFYTLVGRWNKQIINFFYRNVGNQEIAEDLAQEVFISVWKTKSYHPKAPFYSWLYKIAKNKLIDYQRKKKPEIVSIENNPEVLDLSSQNHKNMDDILIANDEEKMIKNAIDHLSEEQRIILIMSKFQKLGYEDIGKIMNCTSDNVKVKVFRAVKSFVKKFRELYGNE